MPKNKARGKRLELIEDVTFKGGIHPIFQRLSDIAFHSVGTPENLNHIVPQYTGERASIQKMIYSFSIIIAKAASGGTVETFTS